MRTDGREKISAWLGRFSIRRANEKYGLAAYDRAESVRLVRAECQSETASTIKKARDFANFISQPSSSAQSAKTVRYALGIRADQDASLFRVLIVCFHSFSQDFETQS